MMSTSTELSDHQDNVRQRRHLSPEEDIAANGDTTTSNGPADGPNGSKSKKTYGRTPDNQVFIVPTTHDMVSQLLDPRQPKNLSDVIVLAILALHILAAYLLPAGLKRPVFAAVFIFWRAAYNVGIGYLLNVQSNGKLLVTWAKKWKLFENPESGKNPRPWLYRTLKRELEAKIPADYKFEEAPIEYNTWLTFRRLVDLILMCDFVSYCLFAIICGHKPVGEVLPMTIARWATGIALVGFNLWVKLDAHRVVKDYAWYWGDFFYLIDQELTFDGVFEMAPHPMYSIGYAGFYGISMMAASYDVLFISIGAHLAQFAFLTVVENPHIEKTYNPPPPRMRAESNPFDVSHPGQDSSSDAAPTATGSRDTPAPVHKLLGLANFDLYRTTDYSLVLLLGYLLALTIVTPKTPFYQTLFVLHALLWRLWHSIGLGVILTLQSKDKTFTRHFLKYGESVGEAWHQWKGMYHLSMALCHASFMAACWKMYSAPDDWNYGWALLKHVVGISLIALQAWTAASIYESLGEFGWFYGDFFFDSTGKLTYNSIYRFLNNPERVLGIGGLWGAALITWSRAIFFLAVVGHLLTFGFISYVEKPHMRKVYGRDLRAEAGLTKFIRKSLPPPAKKLQMSVDKVLDETKHFVDDVLETARSKLVAESTSIVKDTTELFNKYPARLTITRIAPDLAGYDPKNYQLSVQGTPLDGAVSERATGKESLTARVPKNVKTVVLQYGAPIKVKWTAPANHGEKDWIGLYMVTDNRSREVTEVSSLGRWTPTRQGEFDASREKGILASDVPVPRSRRSSDADLVSGEMVFEGDKLWWTQGVFEFRYHHNGSHNVMSVSEPFEVSIGRFDSEDVEVDSKGVFEKLVETALLPIVQNCLDRDPDIAPNTVDEPFGSHVERDSKYAKRVVYAIRNMFGIEFAPAVVPADGNVKKLAWRICNAKQVLAPYSMSHSDGVTTPVTDKFPEKF